MTDKRDVTVLVIDDSAYNRKTVSNFLNDEPGVTVVGKAADGQEGLKEALTKKPDVITLDLEMPRMDGFTFLRLLMAKRPTPVIVISAHSEQENVFRALELGAVDFVAKPTARISPKIQTIKTEVVNKVLMARWLRREALPTLTPQAAARISTLPSQDPTISPNKPAQKVIAIAASTGGPAALTTVLSALPSNLDAAIVIAQHMPASFTTTFADRLDRQCQIQVKEATETQQLFCGVAYVSPGDRCLEVKRDNQGLFAIVSAPGKNERYTPSADRLFSSVASSVGEEAIGIVMTGMGDDGARGAVDLASAGANVFVEDITTAVIFGMPKAVIDTGITNQTVRLDRIHLKITDFTGE